MNASSQGLSFIPTEEQRIRIHKKLEGCQRQSNSKFRNSRQSKPKDQKPNLDFELNYENPQTKILSRPQLSKMLDRLTKNTKKEFILKQQFSKNQQVNISQNKLRKDHEKVQERLIAKGQKLKCKKQSQKQQRENEVQSFMKDKPTISKRAHFTQQKPINQRLATVIDAKNELAKQLISKYQPKFKPTLDPYSQYIGEIQKENEGNFLNRVEKYKIINQQRLEENTRNRLKQEMKDVTFEPIINFRANHNHRNHQSSDSHFYNLHRTAKNAKDQLSFQPKINKNSCAIIKGMKQMNFDDEKCHERLYRRSKQQKQKINKLQSIQNQRYCHIPEINKKSQLLIGSRHNKSEIGIRIAENPLDTDYEQIIIGWNGEELLKDPKDKRYQNIGYSDDHLTIDYDKNQGIKDNSIREDWHK